MARDPSRARDLAAAGCEVVRADALHAETLGSALEGVRVAFYLIHSMGRGSGGDFAERDRRAAANFAESAADSGVEEIVYLGGLAEGGSRHLASRHHTAADLASTGIPVTYLRAAAVIGAGSESFRTLYYLVRRLPVMVTPRWTKTRTQPIAIADVIAYLAAAPATAGARGRSIEIGGPDLTTYGGMFEQLARAMGRRPPLQIRVPLLTPRLSSLWIGLVTPVDARVARPLVEGLASETIVRDPSGMALFEIPATPIEIAMRDAVVETEASGARG
jgi:uncharacterized protein YbjT (DUF2867 family)